MRLLLDTHALLWWLADDPALSEAAREAIASPANEVFVSAVSAWEIAIKVALGKLTVPGDLEGAIAAEGFQPLPFTIQHALMAGALPRHDNDPFDRALVAQATAESCTLVTRDSRITLYGLPTLMA